MFVLLGVEIKDEPRRLAYARFWRQAVCRVRRHGERLRSSPRLEGRLTEYCAIRDFYSQTTDILAAVQDRLAPREFKAFVQYGLEELANLACVLIESLVQRMTANR